MTEKELETELCRRLERGQGDRAVLSSLVFRGSSSDAGAMCDLIGDGDYHVIQDSSDWNPHPKLMQDVIGGMTPDIVLRSKKTKENRIYIEVKNDATLNYRKEDSQVVRYFLHLLAMSRESKGRDIRRAIILAAPDAWFEVEANRSKWNYFLDKHSGLARCFDITLAVLPLALFSKTLHSKQI